MAAQLYDIYAVDVDKVEVEDGRYTYLLTAPMTTLKKVFSFRPTVEARIERETAPGTDGVCELYSASWSPDVVPGYRAVAAMRSRFE